MEMKSFYSEREPEVVRVQVYDEETKEITYKMVSFESYVAALKGYSWEKPSYCRIGTLPRGFVDAAIADKNRFKLILELPEMIRPVIHHNRTEGITEQYMISYPGCVFFMDFSNKILKSSKIYAVGEKKELLYQFPFPNVYSTGNICWGSVKLPQIESLKETEIIPEFFFGADNNNDLFSSNYLAKVGGETSSPKSWFKFLNGKEVFPMEYLKPVGVREDLISNFLNAE